jgi:nitrous oxide reductase accessory protein NosL
MKLRLVFLLLAALALIGCRPNGQAEKYPTCPVCHMKVNPSDKLAARIIFSDGTGLTFESPTDMLAFYFEPEKYPVSGKPQGRHSIAKLLVKDYHTGEEIQAAGAFFVHKSRASGPMGQDLFAFAKESDADSFIEANGGEKIRLSDITLQMVRNIRK